MQINELLLKNFGKFHDRQINLEEGINLIHGENESGKSTIHTFIKGMLFGIERGRGRAAQNDTFSIYEPWDNPNYYSGTLKFASGGKHFRIERNFDKYSKKAELVCIEDGEVLSVEDGDLRMLLGEMNVDRYENTVSMSQRNAQMGESMAMELKNYATNYYTSGNGEIDLNGALEQLKGRKKVLENEIRMEMSRKQQKREKLEQEVSFIWRDVHHLEEELDRVEEELEYRAGKEEEKRKERQLEGEHGKGVMDEIRPEKWRIHPMEILIFALVIVAAVIILSRPWNYLVAIVLFLAFGLYVWNRMKVGKKQVKTEPEIILEEITQEEEKVPIEKLRWEKAHITEELKEKTIQYDNLGEQLAELEADTTDTAHTFHKEAYEAEIRSIIDFVKKLGEKYGKMIPVVVAGGIYTHEDVLRQLELGADGVQVATRFVTTEECDAPEAYKQAYIQAKQEDIVITKSPVGMPGRAIRNAFLKQVEAERKPPKHCYQCLERCDRAKIPYCITDALVQAAEGHLDQALLFCGSNAYRAERIETVQEVMDDLVFGI